MQVYKDITVVFDLDDTLYFEADYVCSGIKYVTSWLQDYLNKNRDNSVASSALNTPNPISYLIKHYELDDIWLESLLWLYRLHLPNICLTDEVSRTIDLLVAKGANVCILTDGRLSTQNLKIKALGLESFKSYISESFGEDKPGRKRFIQVEKDFHSERYIYLGDNPKKDFIAGNDLNWLTVGIEGSTKNIHQFNLNELNSAQLPKFWISKMSDLISLINKELNLK
ncbi:HAD-IA family hydrolase [uncultured Idiomarina sp.]|uniref:HAD family hydrolase n=1 Tax=uncultured Idiomarina sp. TaxID=352961 RepID=UPI000C4EA50B|nr:hypothetical protein [Idiomarinaceae bacterium]